MGPAAESDVLPLSSPGTAFSQGTPLEGTLGNAWGALVCHMIGGIYWLFSSRTRGTMGLQCTGCGHTTRHSASQCQQCPQRRWSCGPWLPTAGRPAGLCWAQRSHSSHSERLEKSAPSSSRSDGQEELQGANQGPASASSNQCGLRVGV